LEFGAAVFEDGTTFGEGDWVHRTLERRRFMLQGIEAALPELDEALKQHPSREQLTKVMVEFRNEHTKSISDSLLRSLFSNPYEVILSVLSRPRYLPQTRIPESVEQSLSWNINRLRQVEARLLRSRPSLKFD
jgi:hypothetical protein